MLMSSTHLVGPVVCQGVSVVALRRWLLLDPTYRHVATCSQVLPPKASVVFDVEQKKKKMKMTTTTIMMKMKMLSGPREDSRYHDAALVDRASQ